MESCLFLFGHPALASHVIFQADPGDTSIFAIKLCGPQGSLMLAFPSACWEPPVSAARLAAAT
jgi:hypothetical protein